MDVSKTDTVETLVSTNVKAAKVLSDHGVDFWAESSRTLQEVCKEASVPFSKLMRKIREASDAKPVSQDVISGLPLNQVTRFIERHFHSETYGMMAFINHNLERLVRIYQGKYPELDELSQLFRDLSAQITIHMRHEELILFPYIREMVKRKGRVKSATLSSSESPITEMIADHEKGKGYFKKVYELTHGYLAPPGTGNTFRVTYAALAEFEVDVQAHLQIENNILFPRALEMEKEFNRATWLPRRTANKRSGRKE